jgi:hypothetical protein
MPRRNSDGTFRNNNQATRVSQRSLLARWVEAEALSLKLLGFTFSRSAAHLIDVGRGMQRPITPLPPGLGFPSNYSITPVACYKAVIEHSNGNPNFLVPRIRQLLYQRSEQLLLQLQPAIQRGDTKAILAAIRALEF